MKFRIAVIFTLLIFISGCKALDIPSENSSMNDLDMDMSPGAPMYAAKAAVPMRGTTAHQDRKIQRRVFMSIEVKCIKSAKKEIAKIVEKEKGIIEDSNTFDDDAGRKSLELTVRVPSDKLDKATKKLRKLGHVREENMSGEDVTEQYFDLETRLANAKKLEKRMLELVDKESKRLKNVLEVEKELARVREKIERLEGQKKRMDNRVDLATIDLKLTQPLGWGRGIFYPLKGLLHRALGTFTASIAALIVVISAAVPWICVIVIFFWFALVGLRYWIRKKREAKERKQKSKRDA